MDKNLRGEIVRFILLVCLLIIAIGFVYWSHSQYSANFLMDSAL